MNKKKLTRTQQKLIIDNYELLRDFIDKSIANKDIPKHLLNEFISDMFYKFCISALKFREDSGFKFSTYAYGGFRFGVKEILQKKEKSLDISNNYGNIDDNITHENIPDLEIDVLYDFIDKSKLKLREKSMIEDYYYNNLSMKKISEKHKISKEGVRLILKKAVRKLKFTAIDKKIHIEDFYK